MKEMDKNSNALLKQLEKSKWSGNKELKLGDFTEWLQDGNHPGKRDIVFHHGLEIIPIG